MLRAARHIIVVCLAVFACTSLHAQSGFYVPPGGKIFFVGDSATIFSDVTNKGNFGVGSIATVNFKAKTWNNDQASRITDESYNGLGTNGQGGWIRFMSDSGRQFVLGGYNAATHVGPSFPRLRVDNKDGISLVDGSARIRNEVNFHQGHFFMNDQILVVGNNDPGKITGYDSSQYFVTGNRPGSGMLLREKMNRHSGIVVFPVGSHEGTYTPAGVRTRRRQTGDYYVTVFDSVMAEGSRGPAIISESVNKTWQIGKIGSASAEETDIFLEHNIRSEGAYFAQNRDKSYISQYNRNTWDQAGEQTAPAHGQMGNGTGVYDNGRNMRTFNNITNTDHFYTKLTGKDASKRTRLWFNAYRVDSALVKVYWKTNPEINVRLMIVERRLSSEAGFRDIDTLASLAVDGYSVIDLNYKMFDPNAYKGISFYRLRMLGYDNSVSYSQEVPVGPMFGQYTILLWPNPAVNQFNIGIPPIFPAKTIIVYNVLGQQLRSEEVGGRTVITMGGLIPGTTLSRSSPRRDSSSKPRSWWSLAADLSDLSPIFNANSQT